MQSAKFERPSQSIGVSMVLSAVNYNDRTARMRVAKRVPNNPASVRQLSLVTASSLEERPFYYLNCTIKGGKCATG